MSGTIAIAGDYYAVSFKGGPEMVGTATRMASENVAVDETGVWVAYSDVATVPKISVMRRPLP